MFTPESLETIYAYSGGTPRVVNIVCDNAMVTAYALGRKVVDPGIIREVADDLCLDPPTKIFLSRNTSSTPSPYGRDSRRLPQEAPLPINSAKTPSRSPSKLAAPTLPSPTAATASRSFLDHLITELTSSVGPMARVIAREQITSMGETLAAFPIARLRELVKAVSDEILNDELKRQFQNKIEEEIRNLER